MGERGVADRIGGGVRRQFGQPGRLVAAGDLAQHGVDETRSHRVEFDPGLLHGGGHRGVIGDVGAQQLVGAQPQQVEQHRVDLVHRPARRRGDDRIEQTAGAAGAVGQFGGECRVAAMDSTFGEQRGQRQVGVGVALGDRAQHVEGGAPGRVEFGPRPAPRGCGTIAARIPAGRPSVSPAVALVHEATRCSPSRAPRNQSSAPMAFLPGGCTWPSNTGAVAVPTRTPVRSM